MKQLDNSKKSNRTKQACYWNIQSLQTLHSLSTTILHHKYPQLHTQTDRKWHSTILSDKNKSVPQTFLSRSAEQLTNMDTFDRVALYKEQLYQKQIFKYQFWTKVLGLKPVSREDLGCREIVRKIVWGERVLPYTMVVFFATAINNLSGIVKLKFGKRMTTFAAMFIMAQVFVRVKKSSSIFYRIPQLPDPKLEAQRKSIIRQCLVLDGKIHTYDANDPTTIELENISQKQIESEKRDILEVLGYNPISLEDVIKEKEKEKEKAKVADLV